MQERWFERVVRWARPLNAAEVDEPRVRHAGVHRRERPQFVPDRLDVGVVPLVAQAAGEFDENVGVVACAGRCIDGLAAALHAPFAVGDGSLRLAPGGRCRQDDVGEFGRLGEEYVLHDHVLEAFEDLDCVGGVGL